jgi:2-dehydropantoate 2-reductase
MLEKGLFVSGKGTRDNFSTKVNAMHICAVQRLANERPLDVALIAVKAYDTSWATALIRPYLASNGIAISMQNGINEDQVAAIVGWERTLGVSISGCGVDLYAPGHVRRANVTPTGQVVYRVGEVHGRPTARAKEVARALSAADSAAVTSNLWGERWSKLVVNSMRLGLAAVTRINIPEQDRNDVTRSLMIRLGSEAVRVGWALGYELAKIQGIEPETLVRAGTGDPAASDEIRTILLDFASRYEDNTLPSLAQDIVKGRRTEIDGINGLIVEKGLQTGIPTPANRDIWQLVKRLEHGELEAGLDTVRGL